MAKKAKEKKLATKPRPTQRIRYGTPEVPLYWRVKVTDAKQDVKINGTLMDAILGTPGETIGCHMSNCAKNNRDIFPHPFILASVIKSCLFVVTKATDGAPSHAIRYVHSYRDLVELNDTDTTRETIRNNPSLAERQFILRAPRGMERKGSKHGRTLSPEERRRRGYKTTGANTPYVPRGALARAVAAKLVTADLARVLEGVQAGA